MPKDDKPVSLYPMKPDDAIEAALRTPPPPKNRFGGSKPGGDPFKKAAREKRNAWNDKSGSNGGRTPRLAHRLSPVKPSR